MHKDKKEQQVAQSELFLEARIATLTDSINVTNISTPQTTPEPLAPFPVASPTNANTPKE